MIVFSDASPQRYVSRDGSRRYPYGGEGSAHVQMSACSRPGTACNACTGTIRAAAAVSTKPEGPGRIQVLRRHGQHETDRYESALLHVEAERQFITTL